MESSPGYPCRAATPMSLLHAAGEEREMMIRDLSEVRRSTCDVLPVPEHPEMIIVLRRCPRRDMPATQARRRQH